MQTLNFKETVKELGLKTVGEPTHIIFEKLPGAKEIQKLQADCGCTAPVNQGDAVSVTYIPGQIPEGVIAEWKQSTDPQKPETARHRVSKGITVTYTDQTSDRLVFSATVKL